VCRNKTILRNFQALELRLLGCRALAELIQILLYDNRVTFGWDIATLTLMDPKYEIRRLLDHASEAMDTCRDLILSPISLSALI
jgi:uncharacterized protein YigA (DUF484 family)